MTVKFKKQNVKKIVHPKKEKRTLFPDPHVFPNLHAGIFSKVEYLKSYIMIIFFIKTKQTYMFGRT